MEVSRQVEELTSLRQHAPFNPAQPLRGVPAASKLEVAIRQHAVTLRLLPQQLPLPDVGERHLADPQRVMPLARSDVWILIANEHSKARLAGNHGTSFRLVVEVATIAEIGPLSG
jgi:hypothetical protein